MSVAVLSPVGRSVVVRPRAAARPVALRLTPRGRACIAAAALALALVGGGAMAQQASAGAGREPVPVTTHTVVAGETLWEIAGTIARPGEDLRDVVDRIVELNGMPNAQLRAGAQILLPLP